MIGLDASDKRVFSRFVHHKLPDDDPHGDQIFTLTGMELTLDCVKMRSTIGRWCTFKPGTTTQPS